MLQRIIAVGLLAGPVLAQSNAVPGLDILMYDVTDIAYQGRRGAAFPGGEAGFMLGHSWCNSGTVNLPWVSQSGGVMVDQYPRISFLLARESGGRMVQVNYRGHSKHSPTAYNFTTGPCLPCNAGSGSFFFTGCSDTYGSGINQSQYNLGPDDELDPWLGTWDPRGSYFDRGDPPVTGPAATDSVRSLTSTAGFDAVKNKITVRESELLAGATYYGQVYAVVQGEPGTARGNNTRNIQVSISGSGGSWNAATTGGSMAGSVLTRWQGANWNMGGNGNGDGSFLVAVKVTGPVAGMWHYEYAIHNLDNSRGGASFRIPLAPGATVANAGFRDIDADPLNEWTVSQTATELAFNAVGTNALNWNTIYNCWFDCSVQPGAGAFRIDEARVGTGALTVSVQSDVPSGLSYATKASVGASCGICQGTFYELFASSAAFDLAGRSMTMRLNNNGSYDVVETPVAFVPAAGTNLGLALNTQTTVALPFSLPYPGGATAQLQVGSPGYVSPLAQGAVQLLPTAVQLLNGMPRWAAAWGLFSPTPASAANVWFDANPTRAIVTWNGVPFVAGTLPNTFQIQFFPDGTVHVLWQNIVSTTFPIMAGWTTGGGHRDPGSRDLSATLTVPSSLCGPPFDGMSLDTNAMPVIGTTIQWQVNGCQAGTAWGALIRSVTQSLPPVDLTSVGMPGCFQHVASPLVTTVFVAPGASVQVPQSIPNSVSLVGVRLVGQAAAYSPPLTPLGVVVSNAIVLTAGL